MKIRLTKVPKEIQRRYGIGPIVEGKADDSVGGGHLMLVKEDGGLVSVDAVELTGTGIMIEEL